MVVVLQCIRWSGRHSTVQLGSCASSSRAIGSSTRCTLLLCVCGQIGFTLAPSRHLVVSPSDTLARALTLDDHCCHGSVLLLWDAERGGCGPLVTWETVLALVSLRLLFMSASVVQMARLQQLALPALLLVRGSGAAARRGQSRDRHFARVFASTVVNAADADQCVSVAPRGYVLCTWLCGIHCVPWRGATVLLGHAARQGRARQRRQQ